jgi:Ca2+-binding EF-hand superfamily protein
MDATSPLSKDVIGVEEDVPDEEIDKLQSVFDSYDSNCDGVITYAEFCKLVSDLGTDTVIDSHLEDTFNYLDKNKGWCTFPHSLPSTTV